MMILMASTAPRHSIPPALFPLVIPDHPMPNQEPDVIGEEELRERLGRGYQAVVLCVETPMQNAYFWHGVWHILCVSLDGRSERLLISARRDAKGGAKAREFRTANGLVSFVYGLGFRTVMVPMEEGGRLSHNLLHHGSTRP